MTKANLTNAEHVEMDDFLGRVLGHVDKLRTHNLAAMM